MTQGTVVPIRVARERRGFETFDGQPFLFIGFNDALSWASLQGLYRRKDVASVETYLRELAEGGVTTLRIMLEYAHDERFFLEKPVGTFRPHIVQMWDDLFGLCRRYGLRVLLAPWDNFWMGFRWHKHPYNAANGGPAASPAAFFTDEVVIQATLRRFHFVIDRWGEDGVIAAWDLFNEIHPYWGGTPDEQSAVIARISESIRQREQERWGWTRPQTVSIFGPEPPPEYQSLIFQHPSLDFATTHIYQGAIDIPRNTVTPAVTMARWVRYARARVPHDRPFLDTEHGPIHLFNDHKKTLPEAFDDEYERHMMWAHFASGGAGSGMRWPARHPHVLTAGMKRNLFGLAAFSKAINWHTFNPAPDAPEIRVGTKGVLTFGCSDGRQAVGWLLRGNPQRNPPGMLPARLPLTDVRVVWRGMEEGAYRIRLWDTRANCWRGGLAAQAGCSGHLTFTIPELHHDCALAIRPSALNL